MGNSLLDSLTVPCLQEFHTDDMEWLIPAYLPALVHRSSCSLTRITLLEGLSIGSEILDELEPIPGVTGLVLASLGRESAMEKLLLEEYFPDLRRLTLLLRPFIFLWEEGLVSELLDRKGPRPDAPNEERPLKLVVVDPLRGPELDDMWNSDIGKELKAMDISLREDGFEFL
jgi:hypothetical protein